MAKQNQKNLDNIFEQVKTAQNMNTAISEWIAGMISGLEMQNSEFSMSENKLLIGETEMKYKNIKIKRTNSQTKSWFARFRKNGKQYYVSAKTQLECYNLVKQTYQSSSTRIKKSITLIDWYSKWLDLYKKHVKENTLKEYKNCLRHSNAIANIPIDTITTTQILEILANIEAERQRQKVFEFLKDLFDKALINDVISKNPILKIKKPAHRKETTIPLSRQHEIIFEQYCLANNLDMFLFELWQGLRPGEVLAIQNNNIDIENKILHIEHSLNNHNVLDSLKKDAPPRTMPLREKSIKLLQKYKNVNGRLWNIANQTAKRIFKETVDKLFPGSKYTMKSLRSTFITYAMEQGIPLHVLQAWVGHVKGSQVTEDVYTKYRPELALSYFNKIDN